MNTENQTPDVVVVADTKETAKPAARAKKAEAAPTHQRVIIRKPYGVKDSHIFVGFNQFEGQFAYDKPVKLPIDVVAYLRGLERVEYSPDDTGSPQASYSPLLAILDAPEEVE